MLWHGAKATNAGWRIVPLLALGAVSTVIGQGLSYNYIGDDTEIINAEYSSVTGLDSVVDQEKLSYIKLVMKHITSFWIQGEGDKTVIQGNVQSIDSMNSLLSEIFILRESILSDKNMKIEQALDI
jgi:hypothetical protein